MLAWVIEATQALREVRDIVVHERDCLIESYCSPPKDGGEYNIETISDRHAYNDVVEYGALLARIDALLERSIQKAGEL